MRKIFAALALLVLLSIAVLAIGASVAPAEAQGGYLCVTSGENRWKTENSASHTLPAGQTFSSIVVKAGQDCITVYPNNEAPTCYQVVLTGNSVSVLTIGSGPECKDVSHLEGTFTEKDTTTPDPTPVNTDEPTPSNTEEPTPVNTDEPTPVNTVEPTPTVPQPTPTPPKVCGESVIGYLFHLVGPDGREADFASFSEKPGGGWYIPNTGAQQECLGWVAVNAPWGREITIDCNGNINVSLQRCLGGGCDGVYND